MLLYKTNFKEGKSALNLAIKTANENKSTVILANDPDADRLAVAERQASGDWRIFNGNEIGALLGWWLWYNYTLQHMIEIESDPTFRTRAYMLYSTVSSHIIKAGSKGFNSEDKLAGFKWTGNRTHELLQENKHVLFCFEEAIGLMCGRRGLYKDGVSAEMAIYLRRSEGKRLSEQLDCIYDK